MTFLLFFEVNRELGENYTNQKILVSVALQKQILPFLQQRSSCGTGHAIKVLFSF